MPPKSQASRYANAEDGAPVPCQLYLQACVTADAGTAMDQLATLLANAPVPSLLIGPRPGEKLTSTQVLPFVEAGHAHGVAVMIMDDANLARTVKADGVHLTASPDVLDRFSKAREISDGLLMIGADAGQSRHDAMTMAEADADYIAFGIPFGTPDPVEAARIRHDLVAWWSDVFTVPCVACDVANNDEAFNLAQAGADFVCMRQPQGQSASEIVAWANQLTTNLGSQRAAAA